MFPEILSIGRFTLHSYGMLLAIGFIAAFFLLKKTAKIFQVDQELLADAAAGAVISGIAGARLLFVLMNPDDFIYSPLSALYLWEGGLVFFGGFIGGLLWLLYFSGRSGIPVLKLLDAFAPSLLLAHAFGRLGCFLAGCCWGIHTDSFLGVKFTHPETLCGTNLPVHPVQLYSSLFLFIFSYILYRYLSRKKPEAGSGAALYLFVYGTFRFFIEFLRGDDRGRALWGLSTTQTIAAFLAAAGLILFRKLRKEK